MSSINLLCRTCMTLIDENPKSETFACNIFTTDGLAEKLMSCSNTEIKPFDEYPPNVCNTCCINILDFCDFQDMCRESLEKFKKFLEQEHADTNDEIEERIISFEITSALESDSSDKENTLYEDIGERSNDSNNYFFPESKTDVDHQKNENAVAEETKVPETNTLDATKISKENCEKIQRSDNVLDWENMDEESSMEVNSHWDSKENRFKKQSNPSEYVESETILNVDENISEDVTKVEEENNSKSKSFHGNKANEKEKINDEIIQSLKNNGHNSTLEVDEEDRCIFEDNSEDEWPNENEYISEDEAIEDYVFSSPSEDEVICSDSEDISSSVENNQKTKYNFFCKLCPKMFILEHRYHAHLRKHKGLLPYPCPHDNCSRSFHRLTDLRRHVDDHNGVPQELLLCPVGNCGKKYTTKLGLKRHMLKHHHQGSPLPQQELVCETCGNVYATAFKLRVHQYLHVDESLWPFKCDIEGCSKRFRSKANFKIHKNRHLGIKPYACSYCDKSFCSSTNRRVHENYHTYAKTWPCTHCSKVFYTPKNLKVHVQRKHENHPETKYPCRYCDKKLSSEVIRKSHEMRHRGERPYVCEKCGQRFTQETILKYHMRTHMPLSGNAKKKYKSSKKYPCNICNVTLNTGHSFREHQLKHTNEKPYMCSACGVKFRYQSNYNRHQKESQCGKSRNPKNEKSALSDGDNDLQDAILEINGDENVGSFEEYAN